MAKPKKKLVEHLNYHEGLSRGQIKIVLTELGLDTEEFNGFMLGQTCPIIPRYNEKGKIVMVAGVYEEDLFRWIDFKKRETPLTWD